MAEFWSLFQFPFPVAMIKYPGKGSLREDGLNRLTVLGSRPSLQGSRSGRNIKQLVPSHPPPRAQSIELMCVYDHCTFFMQHSRNPPWAGLTVININSIRHAQRFTNKTILVSTLGGCHDYSFWILEMVTPGLTRLFSWVVWNLLQKSNSHRVLCFVPTWLVICTYMLSSQSPHHGLRAL